VNARGFMQIAGEHYESDNISSPATNEATLFCQSFLGGQMNYWI